MSQPSGTPYLPMQTVSACYLYVVVITQAQKISFLPPNCMERVRSTLELLSKKKRLKPYLGSRHAHPIAVLYLSSGI
jgi:hypothetical protein